ncbi:GntR family transcriptional regulator [Mesorhizobium sp. AaZ16]|uniref:GntR family transcriptional regulator n=1 Tax=Mesorhizobium sp. AaZ16 TaxID=3402289 RepID=UPI00374F66E5
MDHTKAYFSASQIDGRLPKTTQVYELIRAAIISMRLPPGEAIVEKDICQQLGISRTPLREAVLQLVTENLVVVKPGGGTFVNRIIIRQVLDGQITRDTLEMRLVRLAARNFPVRFVKDFEVALFRQAGAAEREDVDEFFDLDNEFHHLICICSGFPNCWRTIHGATGQLDRVRRHAFPTEKNFLEVYDEHKLMFESIRRNDEEGAAVVFQKQLDSTFGTIEIIRSLSPELFSDDEKVAVSDIR